MSQAQRRSLPSSIINSEKQITILNKRIIDFMRDWECRDIRISDVKTHFTLDENGYLWYRSPGKFSGTLTAISSTALGAKTARKAIAFIVSGVVYRATFDKLEVLLCFAGTGCERLSSADVAELLCVSRNKVGMLCKALMDGGYLKMATDPVTGERGYSMTEKLQCYYKKAMEVK